MTIDKRLIDADIKMKNMGISKDTRRHLEKSTYCCWGKMAGIPNYLDTTLGKLESSTKIVTPEKRNEFLKGWIFDVYNSPFQASYNVNSLSKK